MKKRFSRSYLSRQSLQDIRNKLGPFSKEGGSVTSRYEIVSLVLFIISLLALIILCPILSILSFVFRETSNTVWAGMLRVLLCVLLVASIGLPKIPAIGRAIISIGFALALLSSFLYTFRTGSDYLNGLMLYFWAGLYAWNYNTIGQDQNTRLRFSRTTTRILATLGFFLAATFSTLHFVYASVLNTSNILALLIDTPVSYILTGLIIALYWLAFNPPEDQDDVKK